MSCDTHIVYRWRPVWKMTLAGSITEHILIKMHVELLRDFANTHRSDWGVERIFTLFLQAWWKMTRYSCSRNMILAFVVQIVNNFLAIALPTKIILGVHRDLSGLEAWSVEGCIFLVSLIWRWRRRNIILRSWWGMNHISTPFLKINILINFNLFIDIYFWREIGIKSLHTLIILVWELLLNYWWWLMLEWCIHGSTSINNILSDLLSGIFFLNFVFHLVFFFYNAWLLPLKLADRTSRGNKMILFITFFVVSWDWALALFREGLHLDVKIACEIQKAYGKFRRNLLVYLFAI